MNRFADLTMTCQSFLSLLKIESLQLVVNHPWFGSPSLTLSVKADRDSICSTVCHNSDHIVRGNGNSLKTLSALPRPVRPIFSKISDLHFIMCHISSVPRGNGFSQSLFRFNKQNDALCYNIFLQPDKEIDFARNPAL